MRTAVSVLRARTLRTTAVTTTALAATLMLTACEGEVDVSTGPSSSASDAPAEGGSSAPAADTGGAETTGGAGTQGGSGGAAADSDSSRSSRCHTADLSMDFVPAKGAADTGDAGRRTAIVLVHNDSKRTCTLQGFPGVDLKNSKTSWSLTRSSEKSAKTAIKAGDSTQFKIMFLPYTEGAGARFEPDSVVITPPNTTKSLTIDWPWTAVLRQDGATHPGTFVGPIGS